MTASTSATSAKPISALPVLKDSCEIQTLDRLQPRLCGIIQEIAADDEDTERLKAMGVCIGRRVEVIQRGDPLILRVLGSRLGISSRLAARVKVQSCEAPECQPSAENPKGGHKH